MSLLEPHDRDAVEALAAILATSPFLEERIALERRVVGPGYAAEGPVRRTGSGAAGDSFPELAALHERAEALLAAMRARREQGHE
ncbi:MAG: hypothetical protein K2X91_07385, partial [Thermoleophilia bacterium]|nr:hypothetical protein [Thermoleophilia bacterium]